MEKPSDWVEFGKVARGLCNEQAQYASRAVDGRHGFPNLGEGLRFRHTDGGPVVVAAYHFIEIHKDDVATFVQRWKEHEAQCR